MGLAEHDLWGTTRVQVMWGNCVKNQGKALKTGMKSIFTH
ncbi:hypothetical protein SPONL_195 [uncultured Candidatus Thioglobus sp.]|nr:hypothetical protein SPONL_195 [uncultured Candidatus Thioglobus sp.]